MPPETTPNDRPQPPVPPPPAVAGGASPIAPAVGPKPARIGIVRPLRHRDFAFLWSGMTISLIGDGIYLVAIAFQVYALSNSPTALSLVFFAWTLPTVLLFLLAGILSDRFDRRLLMIAADLVRGLSIGVMGVLSITGNLRLPHVFALVAIYGAGEALFMPAFTAIVPDIVPKDILLEANALDQFVRPVTMRFLGPAIGGVLVATASPGPAFIADAGTFVLSAVAVALVKARPPARNEHTSAVDEIAEGFRFARQHVWFWGTILMFSVGLLFFFGPLEVLVPYVVKNDLGGDAGDFGAVLACGGVGAILVSVAMGQRGLPKRHITFMFVSWGLGVLVVAAFALVTAVWQAMIASALMSAMFTGGMIVWGTLMHKLVPTELLGRVSSLDWLVSTALIPISFVLTGPIADRIGVDSTLIGAGVIGCGSTLAFLALPGLRDTERDASMHAEEAPSVARGRDRRTRRRKA